MLILALLWFVNLVNFMDGLDLMTVAEMLPITAALAAFGLFGRSAVRRRCPSHWRSPARCSASRHSTDRCAASSSETSAACRSACCSAGACSNSPRSTIWSRRCCCRCTISLDATITLLRRMAKPASRFGRRTARTSISARTDHGFNVRQVIAERVRAQPRAGRTGYSPRSLCDSTARRCGGCWPRNRSASCPCFFDFRDRRLTRPGLRRSRIPEPHPSGPT